MTTLNHAIDQALPVTNTSVRSTRVRGRAVARLPGGG
jgi:hypothetical protein